MILESASPISDFELIRSAPNVVFEFPNEQWSANADQRTRLVATGQEFAELPHSELRRRRRDANASLDHLRQEANVSTLPSLRRQRDRTRRRLEKTMQEYTDLQLCDDAAAGGDHPMCRPPGSSRLDRVTGWGHRVATGAA